MFGWCDAALFWIENNTGGSWCKTIYTLQFRATKCLKGTFSPVRVTHCYQMVNSWSPITSTQLRNYGAQVPKWEQKWGRVPPRTAFSPSYLFSCPTPIPLKHAKSARYTNKSAPLALKPLWTTTFWFLAKHFFPVRPQPAGCCCLIFFFGTLKRADGQNVAVNAHLGFDLHFATRLSKLDMTQ